MSRKQPVIPLRIPALSEMERVQAAEESRYPYWPVWRIAITRPCDHVILSDAAVGLWHHHVLKAKRTTPCYKPFGVDCPYCGIIDARYGAYLAVARTADEQPTIVAVPRVCIQQHPWLVSREDLFGHHLRGRKDGRAHRSPVSLCLSEETDPRLLPRARVPWRWLLEVLMNIWGYRSLLDVPQESERRFQ